MVRGLQATRLAVDEKLDRSRIQLFAGARAIKAAEVDDEDGEEEGGSSGEELGSDEEGGTDDEASDSEGEEEEVEVRAVWGALRGGL
jgi:hypothetical protein